MNFRHLAIVCIMLIGMALSSQAQVQDGYRFPNFAQNYPDTLIKKRLYITAGIEVGTYIAGLSFLQFIWYKDQDRVPFHFYNDAKGYLQMDKFGHAFAAYRESYEAYWALRWAGVSKKKALIFGAPIGLLFQTPIEIWDGLYENWGFSWSDMGANTFGSALFAGQELLWEEQRVLMKFSYSPSIYPDYHHSLGETPVEKFFYDYNAHTYWFSGNLSSFFPNSRVPSWLNVSLGYSANGMIHEFDNPTWYRGEPFPHLERYRQWLFSLDVDFSRIKTQKKWLATILSYLNMLKVPFPALELSRVEGVRFYPVYY